MATNYIGPGDSLQYTAGGTIAAGSPVVLGNPAGAIGIAATDMVSGQVGTVYINGLFQVTKAGSQAWDLGDPVYWDAGNSAFTTTASTNTYAGIAAEAVTNAAGNTTGKIVLNAAPRAATVEPSSPVVVQARIPDSDEVTPAYAIAPVAGVVEAIYTVVQPDATGSAAVAAQNTITCAINGVAITNGVVTIANATAIGAMDSATPTAANVVAAGDVLRAVSQGANTADHPVDVFFVIQPTA